MVVIPLVIILIDIAADFNLASIFVVLLGILEAKSPFALDLGLLDELLGSLLAGLDVGESLVVVLVESGLELLEVEDIYGLDLGVVIAVEDVAIAVLVEVLEDLEVVVLVSEVESEFFDLGGADHVAAHGGYGSPGHVESLGEFLEVLACGLSEETAYL